MREVHKPTRMDGRRLEQFLGGTDPAELRTAAHETARILIQRGRDGASEAEIARMLALTDAHGIDTIAELWSVSSADSLPGALWRLYLLRALIAQDPEAAAVAFRRGAVTLPTVDPVVAGAPEDATPAHVREVADLILRGAFTGDLADALDRAAACCRLIAAGSLGEADASEAAAPERAGAFVARAARLSDMAQELSHAARRARSGRLD